MAARKDPFAIAWLVGNELRQARTRVGETQAEAAARIGSSTSRMNYMETGRSVQRADDVRKLMEFYGRAEDGERLAGMLIPPTRRVWWAPWEPVIPQWHRLFIGLEGFAAAEFEYEPLIVPGLLQTPDYAAALTGVGQVPPLHRDRIVEVRTVRQERLFDDAEPLSVSVVIEEHALDRQIGGSDCMRAQLDHLLEMAERPNVTLQVMPDAVPVHDGIAGKLILFDFADAQSIGYVEYADGAVYVGDYHQVAGYIYRREQLRAAALDRHSSREVISARRAAMD
ncbi:helix-turn-helix domain-containing protein [Pseudonocardia sp. CA-107938]|uniref:helix-turn-helix domain-containing protein n=1 Tax=Pseudonocardia sp. CA-107938 TaxID=3240021 RepID=UPI003D89D952